MVSAFTNSSVSFKPEKGSKFELFSGNVCCEFIDLDENKKIVQKWRFRSWPEGHFSQVTLNFIQEEDCSKVTLEQTGVPAQCVVILTLFISFNIFRKIILANIFFLLK